ncbi:unnamed protein product [Adineta steineri]|uniref:FAD-binding domain-containing protein n=1 Tax=Adineta steineri TaxID=433720 RepID=A0A815XNE8_9BILA|nr:unnamed protein product [Adineta steineri]CAF1559993.1 unnamed protein product [Adineta steineri]
MFSCDNLKAKISLDIAIVGAGIGGLSAALACNRAGMSVTIYEGVSELKEIGAGIQLGPNMFRILRHWGIYDPVHLKGVTLKELSLRRYADDSELSRISLSNAEKVYGASMVTVHRADIQKVLREEVEAARIHIELGSRVQDIDFKNTRIKIEHCSNWIKKDVIIAADGIKSISRKKILMMHGRKDRIRDTGDAAWRILIPAEQIYKSKDIDLIEMLDNQIAFRWIGPDGHIVTYPIRNNRFLNVVFIHSKKPSVHESWTNKSDKKEIVKFYKDWTPRIKKLLDYVPDGEIIEWNLYDCNPLITWIEGNVALLGDAAHPMLPYIAQGAAQAVEDAAVLAISLAMIDNKNQINTALKVYELLRKERAEIIQTSAVHMRQTLHLHDGKQQEERDDLIRNKGKGDCNPDLLSDESFEAWCWGTDVQQQAITMWNQLVELILKGEQIQSSPDTKELPWLKLLKKWQLIQNDQATTRNSTLSRFN